MPIRPKRAYEKPTRSDGYRILVERLWPRGVSKESADLDDWPKDIAPTTTLRKWYGHDPDKWDEFQKKYAAELATHSELLEPIVKRLQDGKRLTFVYAAKDEKRNSAVVLKHYLETLLSDEGGG